MKLQITIEADDLMDNPTEWDGQWKLYSFNRNHSSFKHPDEFFPMNIGLRRKLAVGTAFVLGYFEHGLCQWSLSREGMQCQFDSNNFAGLLIWEHDVKDLGPKTLEDRAKDARQFLKTYTDWCNGDGLWYKVALIDEEGEEVEEIDSCGGFYGSFSDDMVNDIKAIVDHYIKDNGPIEVEVKQNEFSWLMEKVLTLVAA